MSVVSTHGAHADLSSQACLNAPEPADANGVDGESTVESPEETHPSVAAPPAGMQSRNAAMPPNAYGMTADQQQALQYQAYLQQQQAAQGQGYPIPAQPMPGRHNQHQ